MYSVAQIATFSAAHFINNPDSPSHYKQLHGHSFTVRVHCESEELVDSCVVDLELLNRKLMAVLSRLDDRVLNEVPDLGMPTLENILKFIDAGLREDGIVPSKLEISRDSMGQSASYCPPKSSV